MPNFVSDGGEWHAAKESIGLKNKGDVAIVSDHVTTSEGKGRVEPGEDFIYDGPDREAVKMLFENGKETMGMSFRNDPEFLKSLQAYGYSSNKQGLEEYLHMIGFDAEEQKKLFEANAAVIKKHELPKRHNEILIMGGGKSHTGDKEADMIGGFGEQKVRKPAEIKK